MKIKPLKYKIYTAHNIDRVPQIRSLTSVQRVAVKTVAAVLPFRVNNYVLDQLIDWENIPDDPIYQLSFPQEGMLETRDFNLVKKALTRHSDRFLNRVVTTIHKRLNPHPSGQVDLNVPFLDGKPQPGLQHKYEQTVLFFPSAGQTCHTYCTYCFRWAQFIGKDNYKFANRESHILVEYLKRHPEVTDVLITGGDPMIMRTAILRRYIEPLLKIGTLRTIRIGTKSVAWWPYRFVTDEDADDLLRLFEEVQTNGKQLAIMAHYSHPRELSTPIALKAIRRIRSAGANIRCQAPLIRRVNDSSFIWGALWQKEVDAGAIPYYMFVERDTGPKKYFEVPLYRAYHIFNEAFQNVSGLGRTVRGPVMSCTPGKVMVEGIADVNDQRVFVLRFLQGRNPKWAGRTFFAKYDESAHWMDDLKPAFSRKFFFEDEVEHLRKKAHSARTRAQFQSA